MVTDLSYATHTSTKFIGNNEVHNTNICIENTLYLILSIIVYVVCSCHGPVSLQLYCEGRRLDWFLSHKQAANCIGPKLIYKRCRQHLELSTTMLCLSL